LIFGTLGSSTDLEFTELLLPVFGDVGIFELLLLVGTIELTFNLTLREEGSEVEIPGLWDPDLGLL